MRNSNIFSITLFEIIMFISGFNCLILNKLRKKQKVKYFTLTERVINDTITMRYIVIKLMGKVLTSV